MAVWFFITNNKGMSDRWRKVIMITFMVLSLEMLNRFVKVESERQMARVIIEQECPGLMVKYKTSEFNKVCEEMKETANNKIWQTVYEDLKRDLLFETLSTLANSGVMHLISLPTLLILNKFFCFI